MNSKQKNSERLPLLDELNELIEKERTLLSLKLLAQQSETETWKSKYDMLLDKINTTDDTSGGGASHTLEAAAEIESLEHVEPASAATVQRLLVDRTSSWALDLSGVHMEKNVLAKIMKEVFGARSSFDTINSVHLSKCGLTDEFLLPLMSTVRSSRMQALDVSHNEFSDVLFSQLLAVLQERRCTPQYLLMENNPPMSAATRHFEALLGVLTEHTWGLAVSLQDFADSTQEAAPQKSAKKAAAAARKEFNHDYKEITKPPMVASDFLRAFNARLDPAGALATLGKASAKKSNTVSAKSAVLGRLNGLHSMTAFGLTYCQISKKSVEFLGVNLRHLAPTLTDLDLSYAYIGYPGAQMLRATLSEAGCQLVRLGLAGNALGDAGVLVIDSGLKANKTLTYLDLRSNSLSGKPLTTLASTVVNSAVLDRLDLRNNSFGLNDVLAFTRHLNSKGSQLFVRFDELSVDVDHTCEHDVYICAHQIKAIGPVNKTTKLHSIDLGKAFANQPGSVGQAVEVRWQWRPVPLGTHITSGQLLVGTASSSTATQDRISSKLEKSSTGRKRGKIARSESGSSGRAGDSPFFNMGSSYSTAWEVRVLVDNQETFVRKQAMVPGSSTTRAILDKSSPWVACSVVLSDLPQRATIELCVTCMDSSSTEGDLQQFVAFEANGVRLVPLPRSPALVLGGDSREFGINIATIVGNTLFDHSEMHNLHSSTRGMTVLRTLRWMHRHSESSVLFQLRLVSCTEQGSRDDLQGDSPNHHTLGYSWAVYVLGAEGTFRAVAEGICRSEDDEETAEEEEKNRTLKPWRWRQHSAHLRDLNCGDVVVLAAKAISLQPGYPATLLKNCAVATKSCMLSKDELPAERAITIDDTSAFANHDLCSIVLPM